MNPCPCGYYNHPTKECICSEGTVTRYLNRISGPLLDRIDIQIEVIPVEFEKLSSKTKVVIGNFRSVGNNFSWVKDALTICEYDDKTKYEIGYFDTKGNYHLLNRY